MSNRTLTQEQFVKRAQEVHGSRYSYKFVKYKNMLTKVTITCLKHGNFEMLPCNHTSQKQGCKKCANDRNRIKGMNNFFEKAREVHGNKYSYLKVRYINMRTAVEIICPKHGSFWMTPTNHIRQKSRCTHKECATRKRKKKNG